MQRQNEPVRAHHEQESFESARLDLPHHRQKNDTSTSAQAVNRLLQRARYERMQAKLSWIRS